MAPCKAVFIIEWITKDKKVKMNEMKKLSIHNLVSQDIQVVTEKIFYVQPGSRPAISHSCI